MHYLSDLSPTIFTETIIIKSIAYLIIIYLNHNILLIIDTKFIQLLL